MKDTTAFTFICMGLQLVVLTVVLGCSTIFVPHWNATEYNDLVTIAAESSRGTCQTEQVETLSKLSTHLRHYSEFLPNNELMAAGVAQMDTTIQTLNTGGIIGSTFCSLKLRTIHTMATSLAKASGEKQP